MGKYSMRETVELEVEKLRLPLAFWTLLVNGIKSKEKKFAMMVYMIFYNGAGAQDSLECLLIFSHL